MSKPLNEERLGHTIPYRSPINAKMEIRQNFAVLMLFCKGFELKTNVYADSGLQGEEYSALTTRRYKRALGKAGFAVT